LGNSDFIQLIYFLESIAQDFLRKRNKRWLRISFARQAC